MNNTYKSAGVDKEEGYKTVDKIKSAVAETHNKNVLNNLGSFGAFYEIGGYKNPVLVSGTDGVGTKLKIALDTKKYDSIGVDCFAMCANDILCHGAKPLFFLDYLACGKLDAEVAAEIVLGMVNACKDNECALIGGETAEMPGMYQPGDYDVAGFCVGIVEKDQIIDGSKIKTGDKIIALPSSGFHSNGFSLVRKIFPNFEEIDHISYEEWLMKKSNYSLSDISPGKWDILSEIFFYDDKTKKTMGSSSYRSGNYTMEFDYPSDFKGNKDTSIYISKQHINNGAI